MILCSEIEVYRRFERAFPWGVCKFLPDCTALRRRVLKHSVGCGNLNAHNLTRRLLIVPLSLYSTIATSTHYYMSHSHCFLSTLFFLYSFAFHCFCFSVLKLVLSLSRQLTSPAPPLPPPFLLPRFATCSPRKQLPRSGCLICRNASLRLAWAELSPGKLAAVTLQQRRWMGKENTHCQHFLYCTLDKNIGPCVPDE